MSRQRRVLRSGIAPRKAAPAAPPPARPPQRAAAPCLGRGPRCGCALLGAGAGARGSATLAGCARRWERLPLRCEHPGGRRSSRYHSEHRSWSPRTRGQKGGAGGGSTPSASHSPAQTSRPRHRRCLCLGAALETAEVAPVHLGRD